MKKGLVLEGGAMRGLFSAGIIDVMMEQHIGVDGLIGVSAGAAFGCNFISNQPGRAIRYNMKYCNDPRYCGFRTFLKTGDIFGADFCYHEIPEKLDIFDSEAYAKSETAFYVVCTDVKTGQAVYHRCENNVEEDLLWMRASASMPLASRIVEIGEEKLLDGGVADSIPLKYFESIGYEKNIVVLTQPKGYIKKKNKALPLMRKALKAYPNFLETVAKRHEVYNGETAYVEEREEKGAALVLRPAETLPVGRVEHDPQKLQAAYEIGRCTAEDRLEDIRNFLKDEK